MIPSAIAWDLSRRGLKYLDIPRSLKAIKEATGWSHETIARKLRVSYTTVYRWQSGRVDPSEKAQKRILALLQRTAAGGSASVGKPMGLQLRRLPAYSLFSGGGGFDRGLEQARFRLVVATDISKEAKDTFALNWPAVPFLCSDISKVSGNQLLDLAGGVRPTLIHGGPPCQGFSHLGGRLSSDPRNRLFEEFARIASELKPTCVLLENVRSLVSLYHGQYLDHVLGLFASIGYTMYWKVIDAASLGVPQHRERVIFFGTNRDRPFAFPAPSHGTGLTPYATVAEAIMDLAIADDDVPNHTALAHSDRVIARYALIPEGGKLPPLEKLPPELKRENFGNTYKRLRRDAPSLTMVPGNNAFPIHPTLNRSLTPREAARLQSFPDDHQFAGDRRAQCKLVGNAVPPLVGASLGQAIRKHLNGEVAMEDADPPSRIGGAVLAKVSSTTRKALLGGHLSDLPASRGFVDLFSGVGGLTLGLGRAGWKPLLSVDNWPTAGKVHLHNFPDCPFCLGDLGRPEVIDSVVSKLFGRDVGILAGGPPCQGFSIFGHRRMTKTSGYDPHHDPRNRLVFAFVEVARRVLPRWVVMENVPGFGNLEGGFFLGAVLRELKDIGYTNVEARLVNAADYGVPQLRRRLIILGNRTGHIVPWPKRKFFAEPEDWQLPYRTVGEVLTDLASSESHNRQTCHVPMNHGELLVERYKYIPEGGNLNITALPAHLRRGYRTEAVKNYSHVFKRLHRDRPSPTMVPGHNAFPLHPWLNRALTVREAARIQTFPDEMEFLGARQCQCIQVGNAFPPMLAELIGNNIEKAEDNDWIPGRVPPSAYNTLLEEPSADQLPLWPGIEAAL